MTTIIAKMDENYHEILFLFEASLKGNEHSFSQIKERGNNGEPFALFIIGFLKEMNYKKTKVENDHMEYYKKAAFMGCVEAELRLEEDNFYIKTPTEYKKVETEEEMDLYMLKVKGRLNESPEKTKEKVQNKVMRFMNLEEILRRSKAEKNDLKK